MFIHIPTSKKKRGNGASLYFRKKDGTSSYNKIKFKIVGSVTNSDKFPFGDYAVNFDELLLILSVLLIAPNYFASGLGGPDHLMATPLVMQNFRLHKEVSARRLQLRGTMPKERSVPTL
jgi:hypothetical protein